MRIRSVYPAFWSSEQIVGVSVFARLLYIGLWNYVDDEGRGVDNPKLIRGSLFALDDEITSKKVFLWMVELESAGLILRYEAEGKKLFAVPSFKRWQKPRRPVPSKLPAPPHWMVERVGDWDGRVHHADSGGETEDERHALVAQEHIPEHRFRWSGEQKVADVSPAPANVGTCADIVPPQSDMLTTTEPTCPPVVVVVDVVVEVEVGVEGEGEAPSPPAPVPRAVRSAGEPPSEVQLSVVDGERRTWNGRSVPARLLSLLVDPTTEPSDAKVATDVLWEAYCALIAPVPYSRFRKDVGGQVQAIGYRHLRGAIAVFREVRMSREMREQGFMDLSKFMGTLPELIRLSQMPIQDQEGRISERGWAGVFWTPKKTAGHA